MGKFKKFREYLENKKQDLINAKDGLAGEDYDGPLSVKPPQEPTKGKSDKPLPYKAGGETAKNVVWTAPDDGKKKGFGWEATPGMTPQTSSLGKNVEDKAKPLPTPKKKLRTEQFIEKTKDMGDSEFANYILEQHDTALSTVTDLFGNEFTPDPTQTIQYLAGLMLGNPLYMEKFVRELKRRDGMGVLMAELMEHGNTYEVVVDHLEDPEGGLDRTNKLARTMNDRYMSLYDNFDFGDGPEGGDAEVDGDFGESVGPDLDTLMGKVGSKVPGDKFGGGSGPDATPDPAYAGQSVYATDAGGGQNPMGSAGAGRNPVGGSPMGGATMPQFAGPGGKAMPPVMPPKRMKEGGERPKVRGDHSAAHHIINELSMFPHFKEHMKSRCVDC